MRGAILLSFCVSACAAGGGSGSAPVTAEPDAVPFVVTARAVPASSPVAARAAQPTCGAAPREPVRPNPPGTIVKGPDGELVRCGPEGDAQTSRADDASSAMALGHIAVEPVRAVIRARAPCIRRCYEGGLRACPSLADRLVVRFHVDPDGRVSKAEAQSTTMPADVSACVLTEIRALRFPETRRGGITITYPFVLSPE